MHLLIIDFETTGLDFEIDEVIEYGGVVWDTDRSIPLKIFGDFVEPKKLIPSEITKLTGISQDDVDRYGRDPQEMMRDISNMAEKYRVKYFVAHNADFDRTFLEKYVNDKDSPNAYKAMLDIEWICTKKDIPFKDEMGRGELLTMAAKHGFLNPFSHRACTDSLTAAKLLSFYTMDEIMKFRESPMLKVISLAPFDQKDEVKSHGFYWNPTTKKWARELREIVFDQEKSKWNFKYRID